MKSKVRFPPDNGFCMKGSMVCRGCCCLFMSFLTSTVKDHENVTLSLCHIVTLRSFQCVVVINRKNE